MKVIDLFCGAGGFSEGFRQIGCKIILAADDWEIALKSHQLNHTDCIHLLIDIKKLKGEFLKQFEPDVIIGSPPCQDFSVMRFVNPEKREKEQDPSLINAFMRIIDEVKPKYWIWENVLGSEKYAIGDYHILDAQEYGVPQRRKRVFVGNYPIPPKNPYKGDIAPTIIAWELCGGWNHPRGRRFSKWLNRKPTWEEMAHYMGFPKNYLFIGTQHEKSIQIGNAVCPPVAKAIAKAIIEVKED